MARLAAKQKILFYPTPPEIVELIASNIIPAVMNSPDERIGSILDPCCGTGEPLAVLGNHLNLITYGNEIHPQRYAQAKTRLDQCLNGAREFLAVEGKFNIIFNNPPYDQALGGQRMEVEHIKHDLELLIEGGLGIWIIPETIIDDALCHLLVSHLRRVNIRRFPQPEYERFKQVVIFGIKRREPAVYVSTEVTHLARLVQNGLPVLEAGEFDYSYPAIGIQTIRFELSFPEAGTVLNEIETHGLQTGDVWQTVSGTNGTGFDHFQPVLRLTSGHTALVIAAGIVDGTEVEIDNQPHLIKGSTGKRVTVIQESEPTEDGSKQTIREREKLVQTITALNLANGTLTEYNSLDDKDGFADFLLQHQEVLVQTIERNYPPLFEPERDLPAWIPILSRVHAPGRLPFDTPDGRQDRPGQTISNGLLPAQQVRAAALAAKLQTDKAVVLVGEMGSGVRHEG